MAAPPARYLGPHPLIEDNSQRGSPTTTGQPPRRADADQPPRLGGSTAKCSTSSIPKDDDIDYFYTTRLPGEPADGIEGRNSRIVEPRQFRVGVKMTL